MLSNFKKKLSLIYTLSIIVFFVYHSNKLITGIQNEYLPISILLICVIIQLLSIIVIPFSWLFLIRQFTQKSTVALDVFEIYAKSWLGRYIPGKVGWIAGRLIYGKKLGLSKKALGITSLIEIFITIFVAGVLSIPALYLIFIKDKNPEYLVLIALPILIFLIIIFKHFCCKKHISKFINKSKVLSYIGHNYLLFKKKGIKYFIVSIVLILISNLVSSLHILMLFNYFNNGNISNFINFISYYFLSGVFGMIAFFAPAGLGVRELVLTMGLAQVDYHGEIINLIIYSRIITAIADILFFLSSHFIRFFKLLILKEE